MFSSIFYIFLLHKHVLGVVKNEDCQRIFLATFVCDATNGKKHYKEENLPFAIEFTFILNIHFSQSPMASCTPTSPCIKGTSRS